MEVSCDAGSAAAGPWGGEKDSVVWRHHPPHKLLATRLDALREAPAATTTSWGRALVLHGDRDCHQHGLGRR